MNHALMERARSMLSNAGLEHELWAEAVSMACYLVNRSPSMALDRKTSEEVWFETSCDYSNLKIFDCHVYALIPSCQRTKLDSKLKKCIFIGYTKGMKGFWLWDPMAHKIITTCDVHFDESNVLRRGMKNENEEKEEIWHETQSFELSSTSYAPNESVELKNAPIEFGEVEEQIEQSFDVEESSHEGGKYMICLGIQ